MQVRILWSLVAYCYDIVVLLTDMLKLIVNSIGEGTRENDDRSYDIFSQTLGLCVAEF